MTEEENQVETEEEEIEDEKMNLVFPTATIVREMKRHVDSGKMIKKEVLQHGVFNLIHNQYVIKIDFIIRKEEEFQSAAFSRRKKALIEDTPISTKFAKLVLSDDATS